MIGLCTQSPAGLSGDLFLPLGKPLRPFLLPFAVLFGARSRHESLVPITDSVPQILFHKVRWRLFAKNMKDVNAQYSQNGTLTPHDFNCSLKSLIFEASQMPKSFGFWGSAAPFLRPQTAASIDHNALPFRAQEVHIEIFTLKIDSSHFVHCVVDRPPHQTSDTLTRRCPSHINSSIVVTAVLAWCGELTSVPAVDLRHPTLVKHKHLATTIGKSRRPVVELACATSYLTSLRCERQKWLIRIRLLENQRGLLFRQCVVWQLSEE